MTVLSLIVGCLFIGNLQLFYAMQAKLTWLIRLKCELSAAVGGSKQARASNTCNCQTTSDHRNYRSAKAGTGNSVPDQGSISVITLPSRSSVTK